MPTIAELRAVYDAAYLRVQEIAANIGKARAAALADGAKPDKESADERQFMEARRAKLLAFCAWDDAVTAERRAAKARVKAAEDALKKLKSDLGKPAPPPSLPAPGHTPAPAAKR